jgi:hypothetical protein
MTKHAILSASSAERWIACPGSVRLSQGIKGDESSYAHEGTLAHELAFLHASLAFGKISSRAFNGRLNKWTKQHIGSDLTDEQYQEMVPHVMSYVKHLQERVALHPNSIILLEQRLPSGIEDCWGTSDAVIVSPTHVEIDDFKYGSGVWVGAYQNAQLLIYALGALDEYADMLGETEQVTVVVFQPRLDHVGEYSLPAEELRAWRETVRPIARRALDGTGEFNPTEEACRWCPAAGICRARVEKLTAIDFGQPAETLAPEELGELLGQLPEIRDWCKAVDDAALELAYGSGTPIPGWKVVLSGGQRSVTDPEGAAKWLTREGYTEGQIWNRKIKGIGDLEKLLGKSTVLGDLAHFITKSDGRPSMVKEDDPRPPINPSTEAAKDFLL